MKSIVRLLLLFQVWMDICTSKTIHMETSKLPEHKSTHFQRQERASADATHEVVFAVKQRNIEVLKDKLYDISSPTSANYRKHMSREEVVSMSSNPTATQKVLEHLRAMGATIHQSSNGEYIRASAPIAHWENLFSTTFYNFNHKKSGMSIIRSHHYSLPEELAEHVSAVFNTVQQPVIYHDKKTMKMIDSTQESISSTITPDKLKQKYHITDSIGHSHATQSVFEACEQSYSPSDLKAFFNYANVVNNNIPTEIGEYGSSETRCVENVNDCAEASLDVQYLMSLSPNSPTTYWYADDFIPWITDVSSSTNPPLVHSISYGIDEKYVSDSMVQAFDTEAIKLGLIGVTILAASGDDGAVSRDVRSYGSDSCGEWL
eukprot:gene7516-15377_t